MENATKALLIAAAVLIAIVLVALGVSLLGSSGDSADDAEAVANELQAGTETAKNDVLNILGGLEY